MTAQYPEHAPERALSVNFAAWTINGERMSRSDRKLLAVFLERAGTAVPKQELWLALWGFVPQTDYGRVTSRALESAVSRLRSKGVPLVNVWGVGWLLPEAALELPRASSRQQSQSCAQLRSTPYPPPLRGHVR